MAGISQDFFNDKMDALLDLMNWRIGKNTLKSLYGRIYWCDPRALQHAIAHMEDEDRWSTKSFMHHLRDKNALLREEDEKARKEALDRRMELLRKETVGCEGGERCRKCDQKYCDTIAGAAVKGAFAIFNGERTKDDVHAELGEKFPGIAKVWDDATGAELEPF